MRMDWSADEGTNEDSVKVEEETKRNISQVKEERQKSEVNNDDEIQDYLNPKKEEYESLRRMILPGDVGEMNEDLIFLANFTHEQLMFLLLTNADIMEHLEQTHSELYEALLHGELSSDDMKIIFLTNLKRQTLFSKLIEEDTESDEDNELDEDWELSERIRRRQIRINLTQAYQYIPKLFIDVSMSYIQCVINRTKIVAMLDTGSQDTLMSEECARRVNLTRLIDTNWAGNTYGLGVSKQIGRIHMAAIVIAGAMILSSISVSTEIEDLIIGLNIMKTHKCEIDLDRGIFYIGSRGVSTRILSDKDLAEEMKSTLEPEDMKDGWSQKSLLPATSL